MIKYIYILFIYSVALLASVGCEPKKNGAWWNGNYYGFEGFPFVSSNKNPELLTYKCDTDKLLDTPLLFNAASDTWTTGPHYRPVDAQSCKPLEADEIRPVQSMGSDYEKGTPVSAAYQLHRLDATNIEIRIPISFEPTCASAEFESKKVREAWATRIQSCFDDASPHLVGEGGLHLHLRLESVTLPYVQAFHRVRVYPIAAEFRENSGLIGPTASCSTLLHESFHWLGLADEYSVKEGVDHVALIDTGSTYTLDCGCRSPGPDNSIMNSPIAAWIDVIQGKSQSLIYDSQINAVLYPGCQAKNQTFYQCSQYAYTGKCDMTKIPATCRDTSWVKGSSK